jgi:ferric-dicitrate binding protein FerR (iron transport regulator)
MAGIIIANICFAAGEAIEVVKAEGVVASSSPSGKKEKAVDSKSVIQPGNVLATGPNGRAVVRVGNTGYIVLEKNSKVEIGNKDRVGFLRQITGMIYYAINSVKGDQQKVEVRTPVATIGIRGTRFLVADMPDRQEIGMRKGEVNIASLDAEFEIHKKAELDEFEAYQQKARDAIAKEQKEFENYKANSEREFVEYKREFSLGANRMVSFDGKRVDDRPLSDESVKELETIEAYAAEWLKQVRD